MWHINNLFTNISFVLGPDVGYLTVFANPALEKWSPETFIFRTYNDDGVRDIVGSQLKNGVTIDDYNVTVGTDGICTVTSLYTNALKCQLPVDEPRSDEADRRGSKHLVQLSVGNYRFNVGSVKYYNSWWDDPANRTIVIVVAVVLLLLAIVIALSVWQYRKNPHSFPFCCITWHGYHNPNSRLLYLLKQKDGQLYKDVKSCLIKSSNMEIGREIGKGNFGQVCAGKVMLKNEKTAIDCAIKTMKGIKFYLLTCTVQAKTTYYLHTYMYVQCICMYLYMYM